MTSRTLSRILTLLVLLLSAVPASAQGELLDGSLRPFTALPNEDARSKFDLTAIDYGKDIPANYRLGPGDVIVIDLGNVAGDMDQQVLSPQGDVFVPAVGKVNLRGFTVSEATELLTQRMEPYYRNFDLQLTVGRVRKIEIAFSGMVNTPGTYIAYGGTTLSHFMQIVSQRFTEEPLNTAVPPAEFTSRTNTRFRALLPEGSWRRIQVWREGSLFRTVDLGKLMVFGRYDLDLELRQGDRVHVPALTDYVIFDDSVPFSGKVELLQGDDLHELVKLVGGPENYMVDDTVEVQTGRGSSAKYFTVQVRDSRLVEPVKAQVVENHKPSASGQQSIAAWNASREDRIADLPPGERPGDQYTLKAGDLIRMPRANDSIYLVGAWLRPGSYGYRSDWTVFDYIGQAGGFYPGAQEGEARWIRQSDGNGAPTVTYISLKGVMLGKSEMPQLRPGDMLYIPLKNDQWPGPTLFSTLLNFGTQLKIFTD
ncbi:MAG: hypothetical protein GEEBNDBF_00527 [bacterium]|nr:hypothetical protein [bacterium]